MEKKEERQKRLKQVWTEGRVGGGNSWCGDRGREDRQIKDGEEGFPRLKIYEKAV